MSYFDYSLKSATVLQHGREINLPVYDDAGEHLYVYGNEFGPTLLIRTENMETAYEIAIDESVTILSDEVHEAYGLYTLTVSKGVALCADTNFNDLGEETDLGEEIVGLRSVIGIYSTEQEALDLALALAREEELDLIEGYVYQSSSTGTGIVDEGFYSWINTLEEWNANYPNQIITPNMVEE